MVCVYSPLHPLLSSVERVRKVLMFVMENGRLPDFDRYIATASGQRLEEVILCFFLFIVLSVYVCAQPFILLAGVRGASLHRQPQPRHPPPHLQQPDRVGGARPECVGSPCWDGAW